MHNESPRSSKSRIQARRLTPLLYRVLALLSWLAAGLAHAQEYPDKPIRLIVPFAAGNTGEFIFRLLTPVLEARMGQRFIIESRPGASGNVGTQEVARAAPNGHTLLMGSSSVFISLQFLFKSMSAAPLTFLEPITVVSEAPILFVVNTELPVSNLRQLQAYAKSNPGKLNFSSSGRGTDPHIIGETFAALAGVDIVHVPYKGAAEATMAIRTKEVQIATWTLGAIQAQLRSGHGKAIAILGSKRMTTLPDVPTTVESGFPELSGGSFWGLAAPKGTDPKIINRLVADLRVALADTAVANRFAELGMFPGGQSPAEFTVKIQTETVQMKKRLEALRIEPE